MTLLHLWTFVGYWCYIWSLVLRLVIGAYSLALHWLSLLLEIFELSVVRPVFFAPLIAILLSILCHFACSTIVSFEFYEFCSILGLVILPLDNNN